MSIQERIHTGKPHSPIEYLRVKELDKDIVVRSLTVNDIDEIVRVETETWPEAWQASRESFLNRIRIFPQGVIGVFVDGELAGVTTSMCSDFHLEDIDKKIADPDYTWDLITDSGKIEGAHNPSGNAIYVVSVGVSGKHRGLGLGTKLVDAQKELARSQGKEYLYLGARLPNLKAYIEFKYNVTIPSDYQGNIEDIVQQLTGKTLREIAFDFVNKIRSDETEFCSPEVAKPHSITIRSESDKNKPLPMEQHFYGKCGLKPVQINGKNMPKIGFAGNSDEESVQCGYIVYTEIEQ